MIYKRALIVLPLLCHYAILANALNDVKIINSTTTSSKTKTQTFTSEWITEASPSTAKALSETVAKTSTSSGSKPEILAPNGPITQASALSGTITKSSTNTSSGTSIKLLKSSSPITKVSTSSGEAISKGKVFAMSGGVPQESTLSDTVAKASTSSGTTAKASAFGEVSAKSSTLTDTVAEASKLHETIIKSPTTATSATSYATNGALYITEYLQKGQYKEAQKLARVSWNCGSFTNCSTVQSYSGYLTLNAEHQSNLHMMYFADSSSDAPVIFFIAAGPHMSVLPLVFSITQLRVNSDLGVDLRENYWSGYNLVFFEYPIGTGFSYTNSLAGYDKTAKDTAHSLYFAVQQFFYLFPNLRENTVYIHSYSYGSLHASLLGDIIARDRNKNFNFQGLICASAFLNAYFQSDFADLPYHVGLLSGQSARTLIERQDKIKKELIEGVYRQAHDTFFSTIYPGNLRGTLFGNLTGYSTPFHFKYTHFDNSYTLRVHEYVTRRDVRRVLHVNLDQQFQIANPIALKIIRDYDKWINVVPQIYNILQANKLVLFYNGEYDMFTTYRSVARVLTHMADYGPSYDASLRKKWLIYRDDECTDEVIEQWGTCAENLAGYTTDVKKDGRLIHTLVRGGGHFIIQEQDIRTRALIELYVN